MEHERNCPRCKRLLRYKSYQSWHNANRVDRICGSCAQSERCARPTEKERRSCQAKKQCCGDGNPFFGKRHSEETKAILRAKGTAAQKLKMDHKSLYEYWVAKHGDEEAERRDKQYRDKMSKICTGEGNPMYGKPSPQGSGNGWSGWYKGWFFRSLRELAYMINVIEESNHSWRSAETKDLRVGYIDWEGKTRNYFADFLVDDKLLVECKPQRLHNTPTVQLKTQAALAFCEEKGYEYLLTDCEPLKDEEVFALYANGDIKFTARYEEKFKEEYDHQES